MLEIPDHPISRLVNLCFNVGQALRVPWLQYPRSIGGNWGSLTNPTNGFMTELAALHPLASRGSWETILRGAGLAWPLPGAWIKPVRSGPKRHPGNYDGKHPDQRWFFLNGICTDHRIAALNAELLTEVFRRPFTILYNATNGLWLDVLECAIGKAWDSVTEAAEGNMPPLLGALCDDEVERVVLISHSQGTIVAAVLLKALEEMLDTHRADAAGEQKVSPERRAAKKVAALVPKKTRARRELRREDIGKLELYCFANCATSMEPFVRLSRPTRLAPWIESYGNEHDVIAKLGLLAPPHGIGSARIAGDRYRVPGAWGHLFNAHYALPILVERVALEPFHDNLRDDPRLLGYRAGTTPRSIP